ncbi:MAG: hypothetical protein U5L06_00750 [Rhodovibrio sp.]|nr:hypothetical protein [Rhodovibrio sp.]
MAGEDAVASMGHNNPPTNAEALQQSLGERHADVLRRRDELLSAASRMPETVDESTAGKVSDFIKQLTACRKNVESARTAEKEPFLAGGRTVDGYFKPVVESLDRAKKDAQARLDAHLRDKAERERRQREEEARRAQEEWDRRKQAAEAAAQEVAGGEDLSAINAEIERLEQLQPAERAEQMEVATKLAVLRGKKAALTHAEEAGEAELKNAQAEAEKAQRKADALVADMSRTRSDFGSVASLREVWTYDSLDRAALDLEALREHLPQDALDKAVRSFIRAGGRELVGVRIYSTTTSVVR